MAAIADTRKSDRWITPGVIIAALIVCGLVVASVVGAVAYLTARGIDPSPMLDLVAKLVAAAGSVATTVLMLAQRAQSSKTERNTGILAGNAGQLATVVDELTTAVTASPAPAAAPQTVAAAPSRPPVPASAAGTPGTYSQPWDSR